MVDPLSDAQAARTHSLETDLLNVLWARRRGHNGALEYQFGTLPYSYLDRLLVKYKAEEIVANAREQFPDIVSGLVELGFVRVDETIGRPRGLTISPQGIRELGKREPGISWDNQDHLNEIILGHVADLLEIDEAAAARQETSRQHATSLEQKLNATERQIYSQVVPFFAIFVAAFAVILTGASVATRSVPADPWQALWQSLAIMGPVTASVLVLLGGARLATKGR